MQKPNMLRFFFGTQCWFAFLFLIIHHSQKKYLYCGKSERTYLSDVTEFIKSKDYVLFNCCLIASCHDQTSRVDATDANLCWFRCGLAIWKGTQGAIYQLMWQVWMEATGNGKLLGIPENILNAYFLLL